MIDGDVSRFVRHQGDLSVVARFHYDCIGVDEHRGKEREREKNLPREPDKTTYSSIGAKFLRCISRQLVLCISNVGRSSSGQVILSGVRRWLGFAGFLRSNGI